MEDSHSSESERIVNELKRDGFVARISAGNLVHGGANETGEGWHRRIVGPSFDMKPVGAVWTATLSPSKGQIREQVSGSVAELLERIRTHLSAG